MIPERSGVSGARTAPAAPGYRETVMATASGIAVLLASLVNFLGHNEYPLFRPEIGLVVLALVAIAVAVGLLYAFVGDLGRAVLQLMLVYVALDLNFSAIVAGVGTFAIGVALRQRMVPFIGLAAGVVLVTGLAGLGPDAGRTAASPARPAAVASDAPVLVHIIADEHIGIEGMVRDAPEVSAMRETLKAFYLGNGVRLFGGAYSEYLHTVNSIPQLLNFGIEQSGDNFNQRNSVMGANAYFDALGELGYGIHVSQVDFLDYCQNAAVVSCRTRRSSDLHDLLGASIPAVEKARLTLNEMAKLSVLVGVGLGYYDSIAITARRYAIPLAPYGLDRHRMPAAIGALETLDRLAEDLRHARPGDAYFVHELVPHYPYVMDANCRLKNAAEWYNRQVAGVSKGRREAAYFDQISCLLTRLENLFEALESSPAGADAVVIIHGDHGSRVTDIDAGVENEGRFTDVDLITGYSTLFAVRAPGLGSGYDARRQPISKLIETLAGSHFRSADVQLEPGFVPDVSLEDRNWRPVRREPLPAWWIEAE
jgi:hypothetical protein